MPRPSRNVDEQLLRAGRELFPVSGCAGLSLRRLTEHAGVNLGMFHYHFRTKEVFVRQLLQGLYDEMFADLAVAASPADGAIAALRRAANVIAHFVRDQHAVLRRIVADAMDGQPLAREFLRTNVPRHLAVVVALISEGQRAGLLKPMPVANAVAFLAGAVGAPLLLGSALADDPLADPELARRLDADVLSEQAIAERIDLALAGLTLPPQGKPR